jgi:tetraacyldisaccharide 4'-kinase
MIQTLFVRLLLMPFSMLYGLGVYLHERLYAWGVFKAVSFNIPTIAVGNLSMGGAGKTPHIEYLIRLLRDHLELGTLSRGYRRKSAGFKEVTLSMSAEQSGDEPLQFKRKFPDILVAVSESRTLAIPRMLMLRPDLQLILLDDAFQHRAIQPGLNILLTEYEKPFTRDHMLPLGRLREWPSAYKRADLIIVTKCPAEPQLVDKTTLLAEIQPLPHQQVFFSYYAYQQPHYLLDNRYQTTLEDDWDVLLICAIANTDYLTNYLKGQVGHIKIMEFEDHHFFTPADISRLKTTFDNMSAHKKIILTTEKDATRLDLHRSFFVQTRLPVFVLPVEVRFHPQPDGSSPDEVVKDYLLHFKA